MILGIISIENVRTLKSYCERYAARLVFMRKLIPLLIIIAGCSKVPMLPGITAYKIDIQQGNYVTQDMVAKLKSGMSKSQVRFALGTPLVVDPFHPDRWDYIYVLQKRGRVIEQRRIVVLFQDDKLMRIDGDIVPSAATAASGTATAPAKPIPSIPGVAPDAATGALNSTPPGAAATPEPAAGDTPKLSP
jgi:outer membrane protein assembly factor BamE